MKIGILTGGGDVPGLNPCIKAVVIVLLMRGTRLSALDVVGVGCYGTTVVTLKHMTLSYPWINNVCARWTAPAVHSCTQAARIPDVSGPSMCLTFYAIRNTPKQRKMMTACVISRRM